MAAVCYMPSNSIGRYPKAHKVPAPVSSGRGGVKALPVPGGGEAEQPSPAEVGGQVSWGSFAAKNIRDLWISAACVGKI